MTVLFVKVLQRNSEHRSELKGEMFVFGYKVFKANLQN